MMNSIPPALHEPSLTTSDWQRLLTDDPIRACRRYYYQTALLVVPDRSLRASVAAFQRLTTRAPVHFLSKAQRLLADTLAVEPSVAWEHLTGRTTNHANPYLDFVSLDGLVRSIVSDARRLNEQAQNAHMATFATTTTPATMPARTALRHLIDAAVQRATAPSTPDAHMRAHLRATWQNEVAKLAIVLEELSRPDSVRDVQISDLHGSLAPYPNEVEWHQLWQTDPVAARRRLASIEVVRAHAGVQAAFSVGESIAAFEAMQQAVTPRHASDAQSAEISKQVIG